MNESIQEIACKFPTSPIFVGGDFNARVGNLNQLPKELNLSNNSLRIDRHTLDSNVTRNGKILVEYMEDNDFILLNGKVKNDCPAQYTYVSGLGASVIDLIWCNENSIENIVNFRVSDIPTRSDHLPLLLTLKVGLDIPKTNNSISKLVWREDCLSEYHSLTKEKFLSSLNNLMINEVNEIYEFLIHLIHTTAMEMEMVRTYNPSEVRRGKPWFDGDCRELRKEIRTNLKKHKKQNYSKEARLELEESF